MPTEHYPGIARAALEIALDNGGIYRGRPVKQMKKELYKWLAAQPEEEIRPIDAWLAGLSDEDMVLVCSDTENAQHLLAQAPPFTDDFLNRYFEDVC